MPRTRSLAWSELKIGLLSLVAIGMAGLLIILLSGEGGFSWQQYGLKATFTSVPGLKEGAPVRVAGVEVGSVSAVNLTGEKVDVALKVKKDMQPLITSMSTASLGSVSLLGEAAVDIVPSTMGTPIPEWGYVRTVPAPGITEVTSQAKEGLEQATELLSDIRNGRGTVGKLFTDETLYREINSFIVASGEVADSINKGRGTLGRLATDPAAAKALEASLQNLEAVTAKIRSGEGSLGRMLNDDAMARSLSTTSANLETATANLGAITGRINRGEGTAGKLFTDPELFNRLNSTTDRLDKLVASLQQGEGTAGQLLRDKQLYENMNGAVVELRTLVKAITADPKKYLNVRVSLF